MSAPKSQGKPGDPQWEAWDRLHSMKKLSPDSPFNENFDYKTLLKKELRNQERLINQQRKANLSGPDRATASQPQAASLSKVEDWNEFCHSLVDPNHPAFERNTVRRLIRAATAAREMGVVANPQTIRATLQQLQRALLTGDEEKGTKGGEKARFKPQGVFD